MTQYWIVVGGKEIFDKTKELGFTKHGIKSTRRKMAQRIQPGDYMAFYISGYKQFAGMVRVTSEAVTEDTRIWQSSKKPEELYPHRVGIEPVIILDEADWLDAEPYHDRFEWTQRWPRERWTLAYQGNLHEITEQDFEVLKADMEKAAKKEAASSRGGS
ncbi:MAG: EVE domain-containing protein [Dehalococcoidia bacterium]|nr:EVE domain-containing protein [Dehalococcoidia bacterium]